MGFPAYLLGLSLPIIGGVALGLFLANMFYQEAQPQQIRGSKRSSYSSNAFHQDYLNCPVCQFPMNPADHLHTSKCGHKLHMKCLVDLYNRKLDTCPQCRQPIFSNL